MIKNILLIVTGSIASFKACSVVSELKKKNYSIKVVMTNSALKFVSALSFEALSGNKVYTDIFEASESMAHIDLGRWADRIVVCPASANFINKMASGIGDDLASTLFLSHDFKKDFLVFPAMNTKMYEHPVTKESIKKLENMGVQVLSTNAGDLACGEVGAGRLLEPDEIIKIILNEATTQKDIIKKKILITTGGTIEDIDGVRSIHNFSTGQTGAYIAKHLADEGHDICFVHSQNCQIPKLHSNKTLSFRSVNDLQNVISSELKNNSYDIVIHAAAVSDYQLESIQIDDAITNNAIDKKISSSSEYMHLILKKTPKILDSIRHWSMNKEIKIIAFKLLLNANEEQIKTAVEKIFDNSDADYVVQNDLSQIKEHQHLSRIYDRQKNKVKVGITKKELAQNILELI